LSATLTDRVTVVGFDAVTDALGACASVAALPAGGHVTELKEPRHVGAATAVGGCYHVPGLEVLWSVPAAGAATRGCGHVPSGCCQFTGCPNRCEGVPA
jgi:hypothetical protein